jgi:transitional endoplasmic reticulum ATPase
MASTTSTARKPKKKKITDLVDIREHGDQLLIPEGMSYDRAITVIQRQKEYESQKVNITENIPGFVWDAAICLQRVMNERFGWVTAAAEKDSFGENPPQLISVNVGVGKTEQVPWGQFEIPNIEGTIQTGMGVDEHGKKVFQINATVKRRFTEVIKEIAQLTRERLKTDSIYRSHAIKLMFHDEEKDEHHDPPICSFLDLTDVIPEELVFSDDIATQVQTNLFTPIQQTDAVTKSNIPLKRGVLLAGKYGTGKTLAAMVTARLATENGWTFVYIRNASELANAITFARMFEPAIVFAEDVDRVATALRTDGTNDVLNVLDGVLSKNSQIMVVLTTNHVDKINQAMFRPGRLDAIITIDAPDAKAVGKLVRNYAGTQLNINADITGVCEELKGQIPAIIRECVERSKLYAISCSTQDQLRLFEGQPELTPEALLEAAKGMKYQLELLTPKPEDMRSDLEKAAAIFANGVKK